MRVTVTRSGGFGGLTLEWTVQLSDRPDEEQWRELLDRLPWDRFDVEEAEPDRFVYRVRCADREATIPERKFTGAWRELLDRIRESDDNSGHRPQRRN